MSDPPGATGDPSAGRAPGVGGTGDTRPGATGDTPAGGGTGDTLAVGATGDTPAAGGSAPHPPRILPMGDRALLLEVESLDAAVVLHARLAASRPAGVVDLVPAARTVLVRVDPAVLPLAAARAWINGATTDAASVPIAQSRVVELEVVYDGADLADTATLLGISPDELVRRHTSAEWSVAFTGFAPGFGYLVSPDWTFEVPRLPSPRTRVPRGSVGLAGGFTGAYPRETPGGWRLIGTTPAVLFDPDAASPVVLAPGTRVRFRSIAAPTDGREAAKRRRDNEERSQSRLADAVPAPEAEPETEVGASTENAAARASTENAEAGSDAIAALRIVEPGLLATVQDLGRPGSAALGVAPSGALDRGSARTANRLVGNPESVAVIEATMGGFRAVALRGLWFAVTGAWGRIRLDGHEVDPYEAHAWPEGAELQLDWFAHGARAYLAVRGGIATPPALGSRSTDTLAGIGPARLRAGEELAVGVDPDAPIPVGAVAPWGAPHDEELEVELAPGPRGDWFAASAHRALFEEVWTVTNDADRVGMRLDGPALLRAHDAELPSEGMVPGALQVPPSGRPTILLADGPVTGGYPVIAVATDAALDFLAQARPGTRVRFRHARPA